MKTITINTYSFGELSPEVQNKVVEHFVDINVDHDWYKYSYDELKELGIKCEGFDLDRGSYCHLTFVKPAEEVANTILTFYGTGTEYGGGNAHCQAAQAFQNNLTTIDIEEREDAEALFLSELEKIVLNELREEYHYRISDEAIRETIEVNEFEFTKEGKLL